MSNPPNNFNTNTSFNKYKGSYFNDDIDVSGGDIINRTGNLYLADNSSIYTSTNQIQFDDTYSFTNFLNSVNIFGQLKLTYNSIEYDVGLQCEKTDNLIDDVATLSPIVSDTAFKCTNFYYDQASNSTVWSGLLTCPISSIASTAIANTSRFIEGTGNQNVGGIKRFTSNIRIDAGMQLSAGTVTLTNANLLKIALISTISSDIQTQVNTINSNITTLTNNSVSLSALNIFSGATNTFTNNIRLDGSLLLNAGGITITNANLQKLQYISTISSDIQTQITTLTTNSVSLASNNIFTGITNTFNNNVKLYGSLLISDTLIIPQQTLFKLEYLQNVSSDIQNQINAINGVTLAGSNIFTALNQFTNNIRLDGSLIVNNNGTTLTNSTLNKIQYLTNVSSDVNTSLTNLNTSVSTLNTKTTKMSYMSVGGINTTTILDGLISQTFSFTGTINNISTTTFGYLSGATSNLQTQINNISGVSLSALNTFSGATNTFTNNIRLDGSLLLNAGALTLTNANLQKLQYCSTISSNIQTQTTTNATNITTNTNSINSINTKLTDLTYTPGTTTTTIANNLLFTGTLNNIIPTVFSYLSNLTGNIQDQFNTLTTKLTAISYSTSTTTTTITNSINFTGSLNTISATTFGYLYGLTGAIQDQLNALSTRIATFEIAGTIIMSPLSNIQTTSSNKYLLCNGQNVSRSTYSGLFAVIGTNFGSGDGSTTFTLPNYQGLFFRGMGSQTINGTTYTGLYVNNAQQDAVQDHQHGAQNGAYLGTQTSASASGGYVASSGLQRPNQYNFDSTGIMVSGRTSSTETRPVNVGIYYYIKT